MPLIEDNLTNRGLIDAHTWGIDPTELQRHYQRELDEARLTLANYEAQPWYMRALDQLHDPGHHSHLQQDVRDAWHGAEAAYSMLQAHNSSAHQSDPERQQTPKQEPAITQELDRADRQATRQLDRDQGFGY